MLSELVDNEETDEELFDDIDELLLDDIDDELLVSVDALDTEDELVLKLVTSDESLDIDETDELLNDVCVLADDSEEEEDKD